MTDSAPDYPLRSVSTAVALCTLLSRATGFVRVVAVASVLGSGALADVYQSANLLPNLLFELAAGGVLQAILLPSFVAAQVGDDGLADAYGAVVGWVGGALAAVTAGALALALPIGWLLTSTEPSAPVRAEKLDVMVPMLVMFLPQIVLYGLSTMAGAALAVKGRFLAAALAPALGNLIVIAGCLAFRSLRDAAVATLDITAREFLLVAGATTLGVVALAAVPLVALSRAGVRLRPTWQPGHPAVLRLRATVGWAALTVMATFVPTLLAIVLGNAVEGGVAIFVYAFAFFALPHSLIAVTVATTSAPRAAHRWHAGQRDQLRIDLDRAWAVMVPPLCLSTLVVVDRYRAAALAIGYGFTQLVAALVMRHRLNRLTVSTHRSGRNFGSGFRCVDGGGGRTVRHVAAIGRRRCVRCRDRRCRRFRSSAHGRSPRSAYRRVAAVYEAATGASSICATVGSAGGRMRRHRRSTPRAMSSTTAPPAASSQ
jgi:hypothetical protein